MSHQWSIVFGVVLSVAIIAVGLWSIQLARRLDRLHKALISTRHVLDTHLVQRAVAANQLAASGTLDPATSLLLADAATLALAPAGELVADGLEISPISPPRDVQHNRARLESALTAVLSQLADNAVATSSPTWHEVTRAWYYAQLARTFHNSRLTAIVRLRRHPLVRLFRLAGKAPQPLTFDADLTAPPTLDLALPAHDSPQVDTEGWAVGPSGLLEREAARIILVTDAGHLLVVRGHDVHDDDHSWWFTPGGGLLPGEDARDALIREVREETGLELHESDLIGPVATRSARFHFRAATRVQHEQFFYTRLPQAVTLSDQQWTESEREVLDELRWFSFAELHALVASGQTLYPHRLIEVARQLYEHGWDGTVSIFRDDKPTQ